MISLLPTNSGLREQDGQWKARLTSMEGFMEWVKGSDDISAETASLLVQGIAIVPGWSEKNFQVDIKSTCIYKKYWRQWHMSRKALNEGKTNPLQPQQP